MLDRLLMRRLQTLKKSVLLLGARQVGKSTLIRSLKVDRILNLADEAEYLHFAKDPARLRRLVDVLSLHSLVVIDEVQRLPSLLNSVQALLDEKPTRRFILTGSSARKLKRGGANLLPGRIILEHLDPLSFWELQDLFDLDKVLHRGSLPGIYLDELSGLDVLDSYVKLYLREEIQAEAITKNIGAYARFLDLAALLSGQWINYSKVASDSEIAKETVRRYFSILEDTLIAHRVPAFRPRRSQRRTSQRDKFVFFDLGVRNAVLGIHQNTLTDTELGALFEQWFFLQCLSYIHSFHKNWKISSYRSEGGAEVDWILETEKELIAIECKYGRSIREAQLRGLKSFASLAHKPCQCYVVYQGMEQKFSGGEYALPYQKFFREILPGLE